MILLVVGSPNRPPLGLHVRQRAPDANFGIPNSLRMLRNDRLASTVASYFVVLYRASWIALWCGSMPSTVSVIVANHNYGRFVAEAINSVLAQRASPNEILVIDDASTDESREVLASYERRVRVVYNPVNLGIVGNFRKAVDLTSGDYIAWATPGRSRGMPGRTGLSSGCKARSCRSTGGWPSAAATSPVGRRCSVASAYSCSPTITSGRTRATASAVVPQPRSFGAPPAHDVLPHSGMVNVSTPFRVWTF